MSYRDRFVSRYGLDDYKPTIKRVGIAHIVVFVAVLVLLNWDFHSWQQVKPRAMQVHMVHKASVAGVKHTAPAKKVTPKPVHHEKPKVVKKAPSKPAVTKPKPVKQKKAKVTAKPKVQPKKQQKPMQAREDLSQELAQELNTELGVSAELDQLQTELELRDYGMDSAVNAYRDRLLGAIAAHWRVPRDVDTTRWCEVRILMGNDGHVQSVTLLKSSHDLSLDRSILTALQEASPLPVAKDGRVRRLAHEIILRVSPHDLR